MSLIEVAHIQSDACPIAPRRLSGNLAGSAKPQNTREGRGERPVSSAQRRRNCLTPRLPAAATSSRSRPSSRKLSACSPSVGGSCSRNASHRERTAPAMELSSSRCCRSPRRNISASQRWLGRGNKRRFARKESKSRKVSTGLERVTARTGHGADDIQPRNAVISRIENVDATIGPNRLCYAGRETSMVQTHPSRAFKAPLRRSEYTPNTSAQSGRLCRSRPGCRPSCCARF